MVLLKRLDYGFNGYQVPPTPRAARSARRRTEFKKKDSAQKMCAFDLLATVAGKLLLEGECSPKSADTSSDKDQAEVVEASDKKGEEDENKPFEEKSCEQDSCERDFLFTEIVSQAPNPDLHENELARSHNDAGSRPASVITSESSEKVGSAEDDCKLRLGIFPHPIDVESSVCRLEGENKKLIKIESPNNRNLSINNNRADMYNDGRSEAWDRKPSALVSSADSKKFPFSDDQILCGSFPAKQDVVRLVTRDDDEKNSGCSKPSTTTNKAFKPPPHVGDCRTRKLLPSKYWKPTLNSKDKEFCDPHAERCNYLNRNNGCKRQRSQRDYPFKKRKFFDCSSVSNSDEGLNSDGISSVPESGSHGNALGSSSSLPGVPTTPTSLSCERASFQSRNSQVKLKIKSFRVPELFIEVPESATVGSLKRTVMEAVTAILGGGLRVGVLLQGKKIRDDNKTLLQTGISHDDTKLDSLGFTLEPTPTQSSLCLEDRTFELPSPQPLARYPSTRNVGQIAHPLGNLDTQANPNVCSIVESDRNSAALHRTMSLEKTTTNSKALVSAPPVKAEALAMVPMRKSKHSESAQRRIRRPFTVSEVEALVQAVEKLGTGRWRDVKLRAFDNAKHRTYVDLKDKWKTLVHTARISPQQRRGEPVPQELLDRVLTAHAYWSQQQVKQQIKSQPETCLLL